MSNKKPAEWKVPPLVVVALTAAGMWGSSFIPPPLPLPAASRIPAATVIAVIGGGFSVAGILSFRRANTTVNPIQPEAASSLVCSGVYQFTRNPMYVGILLVLVAWAVFLSSALALLGPATFLFLMNRFQIPREEQALEKLFGAEYSAYRSRVRRWL